MVEATSFPFLGGIARFVLNPRLAEVVEKLVKLREEFTAEEARAEAEITMSLMLHPIMGKDFLWAFDDG